jgi:hypothetical protein
VEAKQLDYGIGNTLVSVEAAGSRNRRASFIEALLLLHQQLDSFGQASIAQ